GRLVRAPLRVRGPPRSAASASSSWPDSRRQAGPREEREFPWLSPAGSRLGTTAYCRPKHSITHGSPKLRFQQHAQQGTGETEFQGSFPSAVRNERTVTLRHRHTAKFHLAALDISVNCTAVRP